MFWKRFTEARSATKFFDEATKHWVKTRSYFFVDEAKVCTELSEVIRLCQLSIQADQRSGNAYVLLANALTSAASHGPGRSDQERYEFLQSRAAAVIYLWYTLPHRGYPITSKNNETIGERLLGIIVDEISQDKALSEHATMSLVKSFRDSLAAETISPDSYKEIQEMILGTERLTESEQAEQGGLLEGTLPFDLSELLIKIWHKGGWFEKGASNSDKKQTDRRSHILAGIDALRDGPKVFRGEMELLERLKRAHHDKELRQALVWVAWLFLLEDYSVRFVFEGTDYAKDPRHCKVMESYMNVSESTLAKAREARDWDTLVLAAGFFEWLDISGVSDEVLRVLYEEIGKQAVADRLSEILRQPRALAEILLARHLQQRLGKS